MNIVGIGTDIIAIARIRAIWQRFGQTFAKRILTPLELEEFSKARQPAAFLAKRYAAKEAVAKALGTGFRPPGVLLAEIGVGHDALGKPHLYFMKRARQAVKRLKITESHLSLSDEKEFAIAFVILLS